MPDPSKPEDGRVGDHVARLVSQAKADGIERPVVLVLSMGSEYARAVYHGLKGRPMPPPVTRPDGKEVSVVQVAEAAQAARLLREHGGGGGFVAAGQLENPNMAADWDCVAMSKGGILFLAFKGDQPFAVGSWGYQRLAMMDRPPESKVEDGEPTMFVLTGSESAKPCRVFGASAADAVLSAILLYVVSDYPGFTELPGPEPGHPVRVRVTPELVREMLRDRYVNAPAVVGETVRALRESEPAKAEWLLKLMRNHPPLLELYRAVRRGLSVG